jgi:hypothetical protein
LRSILQIEIGRKGKREREVKKEKEKGGEGKKVMFNVDLNFYVFKIL